MSGRGYRVKPIRRVSAAQIPAQSCPNSSPEKTVPLRTRCPFRLEILIQPALYSLPLGEDLSMIQQRRSHPMRRAIVARQSGYDEAGSDGEDD